MNKQDSGEALAHEIAGDLLGVITKLRRHMRAARPGDLSGSQILTLRSLHSQGSLTVTELAKAHSMRPQSMGAIISALEGANLVQRTPDPGDRRQSILSLTDEAKNVIDRLRSARSDWLYNGIRERLTAKEQKELLRTIVLLRKLAED